jgi:quercetin dioxygenase-like cupin family protein
MATSTTKLEVRSFEEPDERTTFERGRVELVTIGGRTVGRSVFEPGWRWRDHVKPLAGTDSCEFPHFLAVVSGRIRIVMDDGAEVELGPGDVATIPPGHDAEVVGDEPLVTVDLAEDDLDYGKPTG